MIYFQDDARTIGTAAISVKGGKNIHARDIRDLIGAMNNRGSKLGVFLTLNKPTAEMEKAAREAGSVEAGGKLRPRVQVLTIEQLLNGQKANMPVVHDIISAAAAARRATARKNVHVQTPQEIRTSPSFKLPILGGKKSAQTQPFLLAAEPAQIPISRKPGGKRRPA